MFQLGCIYIYIYILQKEDLRRVMDLLFLRGHHARTLLIHYRWDVEKLFAVLVEKGKPCLFSEAGVTLVEHEDLDPPLPNSPVMCAICIEDVPSVDTTKMDCGHCFCNSCKYPTHFLHFPFIHLVDSYDYYYVLLSHQMVFLDLSFIVYLCIYM